MNKEQFTLIPNDFIKGNNTLEGIELSLLITLLMNKTNKNIITCNMEYIYNILNIKKNNSYRIKDIKQALTNFKEQGYLYYYKDILLSNEIENITELKKNELFFCYYPFEIESEFTLLYDYEVIKILNYNNSNINNYTLLELYTYIISCIKNNSNDIDFNTCYPAHETIMDNINISENTLIKYLNILYELQLLIYDIAGYKETVKGQIKNSTTYYSRYKDIEYLQNTLNIIRRDKGYIKLNNKSKDKSNLKRSIKQKINILDKIENKNIIEVETLKLLKVNYKTLTEGENVN